MSHSSQRGATLLELVIGAAVCGLLLGIVLSVLTVVNAAGVRNNVATFEGYSSAATGFRTKYKYLPGDMLGSAAGTYGYTARAGDPGHGNGDNVIEGCAAGSTAIGCENTLFWRDLSQARLIGPTFNTATDSIVDGTASGFHIGDYQPNSPFRVGTQIYVYSISGRVAYYVARLDTLNVVGHATFNGGVKPQEAEEIDKKVDDGSPVKGIVRTMTDFNDYDNGSRIPTSGQPCVIKAADGDIDYNLATGTLACQISVRSSL